MSLEWNHSVRLGKEEKKDSIVPTEGESDACLACYLPRLNYTKCTYTSGILINRIVWRSISTRPRIIYTGYKVMDIIEKFFQCITRLLGTCFGQVLVM